MRSSLRQSILSLLFFIPAVLRAQQPAPPKVTLEQFSRLKWLAGAWQGSGGAYPAFFEEYRVIDDSTIAMRSFAGADLSKVTDSARIEFRNGTVYHRGHGAPKVAVELSGSTVQFVPEGAPRGGFTFSRQSADLWTATLHSAQVGGHETVYLMRRLRQ
jgi:hypothetical protein